MCPALWRFPVPSDEQTLMTPAQVCTLLQCSRKTLDRLLAAGDVPYIKLGRGRSAPVRIARDALMQSLGLESGRQQRRRRRQADAEFHRAMASLRGAK